MRIIAEMNKAEIAYNVGHTCGKLNMAMKYATQLAYEFKEYKLHFYDGYKHAQNEMFGLRKRNECAG